MTVTPEELRQAADILDRAMEEGLNKLLLDSTYWLLTADHLAQVAEKLERKAKRQDIRIVYHDDVDELRIIYIKKLDGNYCGVYLYSDGTFSVNETLSPPPGETADFWSEDVLWEAPEK